MGIRGSKGGLARLLGAGLALLAAHPAGAAAPISEEARARADAEGRARVIVRLAPPAAVGAERAQKRAAIRGAADAALARIGGPEGRQLRRYQALPLLALELSPRELVELAEAPGVLSIEVDRTNLPSLTISSPRVGATVATSSDRKSTRLNSSHLG